MASNDSGQEKTEDATPKRLREARKKGQVPKSKDVSTIVVLITEFMVLSVALGWIASQIKELMVMAFNQVATRGPLEGSQIYAVGKAALFTMAKVVLPICMSGVVVAALAGFLQVGAIFATDPLKPQLKKLNPIEGMKNMFKTQTFIELVKNIAKVFIVFYLAYSTINGELFTILQTTQIPIADAAKFAGGILSSFIIKVLLAFLIISLIDFMVQKKQFMKQMKMTKDEVKREYKQDEGDPLIKSHRRQMHREFAFSDARQAVKQSDVVVTNPVHVAVALKYDREQMVAPEITVRGQRAFAEMIKDVAQEFNIPIMRNIPLAWALFELEEGTEIPEDLYGTVAEILAYVYRMKQMQEASGKNLPKIDYI